MKLFLVFLALAAAFIAVSSSKVDHKWKAYKTKFHKHYDRKEDVIRKALFLSVVKKIEKNNKNTTSTSKMGLNHFSDWTKAEKKRLRGTILPAKAPRSVEKFEVPDRQSPPASYDLRSAAPGCVTNIKNQGQCGSCWSFSAIASLECANFLKNNVSMSLSEQQLVDCDTTCNGCYGGFPETAWAFLQTEGGSESYSVYPYTSGKTLTSGTCQFNSSEVVAKVASYRQMSYGSPSPVTAMENALIKYGTLSVAINANTDQFMNYKSGILNISGCNSQSIDHAVNIVGWGTSNGVNYWIGRNSWSTLWGESGYFQIVSGVNMCWIESYVGYVIAQ